MVDKVSLRVVFAGCLAILLMPLAAIGQQVRQQQVPPQGRRQQASQSPVANGQQASTQVRSAGAPKWYPLTAEHDAYLDQILKFWEFSTGKIKRYRSKFKRWEYELARRADAQGRVTYESIMTTFSEGDIKYAAPDKGLFKVNSIKNRAAPKKPGDPPAWVLQESGPVEHWVCDGKSVFQFNHNRKQLIERPLPPEMQGKQIAEGPLPFLFGAKAEKMKRRFWIRVITPPNVKTEYRLEAIPKTREDAQNFRALHVIIDESDYLPKAIVLFHRNNAKTTYVFENRETNWNILAQQLNPFMRQFFEPALPDRTWEKVQEPLQQAPAAPPNTNAGRSRVAPPRQARTRPGPGVQR